LFVICAVTLCLHNSMCVRYEVEFTHNLVLLAVIGILALERGLASRTTVHWIARCGWGLLLAFSVAFNLFASVASQAEVQNNFAVVMVQKGRLDEAFAQFQRALSIDPRLAKTHSNLGNALRQVGRLDEAVRQYQQALELQPHDAKIENNLANALL